RSVQNGHLEGISSGRGGLRPFGGGSRLSSWPPGAGGGAKPYPGPPFFILWQRGLGGSGCRPFVRTASPAGRPQGHWQERIGGKFGRCIRPPQLGRVYVCQCGRRRSGGGGHPEGRTGGLSGGAHLSVRPAGGLWRIGRG